MGKRIVTATINGEPMAFLAQPYETLLEVLGNEVGLTGSKEGCGNGNCCACNVVLNGQLVNSCCVLGVEANGGTIETIEGVAPSAELLDRVQEAFLKHGGAQCGICTPGMILAAKALLAEHPQPTMAEVREGLAGNLCRCTGYTKIFDSVLIEIT